MNLYSILVASTANDVVYNQIIVKFTEPIQLINYIWFNYA